MNYSRTHAHYMAACTLYNGEAEAMVSEMYDLAKEFEKEVTFLRTKLDAILAEQAQPKPSWFMRLKRNLV